MTTPVIKKVVGDLVCIQLDVHIWSGRRILDKTDLVHANPEFKKLPEKELANLGSVKICDPAAIKQFQTFKNKAITVLERGGLPFCGARAVPAKQYPSYFNELTEIQTAFTRSADLFVKNFDDAIAEWKLKHLLAHPEWDQLFRDLPTAQHVGGRLSFAFHPYSLSAPADDSKPELNSHFEKQVGGLKGDLLREVSTEATKFVESLFTANNGISKPREFVTPKTLGPLRRAAGKLAAFAFIDSQIGPLAGFIEDLLRDMPDEGRIDGQKLISLASVARMMMDHASINRLCAVAADGWSPSEYLSDSVAVVTPPAFQLPTLQPLALEKVAAVASVAIEPTGTFDTTPTKAAEPEMVAAEDESHLCGLL